MKLENNIIRDPGKFEGEQRYVPHFWEAMLDGMTDFERGENIVGFYVTSEDKSKYPELKKRRTVKLWLRDDGFVQEV